MHEQNENISRDVNYKKEPNRKILELKKSMTAIENTLENLGKEAER